MNASDPNGRELRKQREELANAAFSVLAGSPIGLALAFVIASPIDAWMATALFTGGIVGSALAIVTRGRPALAGARFARFPARLPPHELRLNAQIERLRKGWISWVVPLPYLALTFYLWVQAVSAGHVRVRPYLLEYLVVWLLAQFGVAGLSWGAEYVQVWFALGQPSVTCDHEERQR